MFSCSWWSYIGIIWWRPSEKTNHNWITWGIYLAAVLVCCRQFLPQLPAFTFGTNIERQSPWLGRSLVRTRIDNHLKTLLLFCNWFRLAISSDLQVIFSQFDQSVPVAFPLHCRPSIPQFQPLLSSLSWWLCLYTRKARCHLLLLLATSGLRLLEEFHLPHPTISICCVPFSSRCFPQWTSLPCQPHRGSQSLLGHLCWHVWIAGRNIRNATGKPPSVDAVHLATRSVNGLPLAGGIRVRLRNVELNPQLLFSRRPKHSLI